MIEIKPAVALDQLHDELLAAGIRVDALVRETSPPHRTLLDVKSADMERARAIVDAHAPTPPPAPINADAELAAALTAATTLEELKAALLGTTRPAKAAAKPR